MLKSLSDCAKLFWHLTFVGEDSYGWVVKVSIFNFARCFQNIPKGQYVIIKEPLYTEDFCGIPHIRIND